MKLGGQLGMEDTQWLWEVLRPMVAHYEMVVHSIRHNVHGVGVQFAWTVFGPGDAENIFGTSVWYVYDVVDRLPSFLKSKHELRQLERREQRIKAVLRLGDYDGYYLYQ